MEQYYSSFCQNNAFNATLAEKNERLSNFFVSLKFNLAPYEKMNFIEESF